MLYSAVGGGAGSGPHLGEEGLRDLERGEVAAALGPVVVAEVGEAGAGEALGEADDLARIGDVGGRRGDLLDRGEGAAEALPVEARRGRRGGVQPVDHYVVEQLVAGEGVLRVAVAVRPGGELLDDP